MSEKVIDKGDMCLHCREDTKFGGGKFVNRYPVLDYLIMTYNKRRTVIVVMIVKINTTKIIPKWSNENPSH